jgi:hypothetical protein
MIRRYVAGQVAEELNIRALACCAKMDAARFSQAEGGATAGSHPSRAILPQAKGSLWERKRR